MLVLWLGLGLDLGLELRTENSSLAVFRPYGRRITLSVI